MLIFPLTYHVAVAQRISSSQWCLRSQNRSYRALAFNFFSCSISPENSGSVKNSWCKACIYPALIWEIFSRRGPLSSGVIMCMYGNFTVRLVTVHIHYVRAAHPIQELSPPNIPPIMLPSADAHTVQVLGASRFALVFREWNRVTAEIGHKREIILL